MKNSYSALTTKETYPAKCMHQASDQLLINERTCKFAAFLSKLSTKLQKIFGNASGQIIIYSTKETRNLEAILANISSYIDESLACNSDISLNANIDKWDAVSIWIGLFSTITKSHVPNDLVKAELARRVLSHPIIACNKIAFTKEWHRTSLLTSSNTSDPSMATAIFPYE